MIRGRRIVWVALALVALLGVSASRAPDRGKDDPAGEAQFIGKAVAARLKGTPVRYVILENAEVGYLGGKAFLVGTVLGVEPKVRRWMPLEQVDEMDEYESVADLKKVYNPTPPRKRN
jgi:hypothetical protein